MFHVQGLLFVCDSTGGCCLLNLKEAIPKDDTNGKEKPPLLIFDLRVQGQFPKTCRDDLYSVSLLSRGVEQCVDAEVVLLTSAVNGTLKLVHIQHSAEQLIHHFPCLSVDREHVVGMVSMGWPPERKTTGGGISSNPGLPCKAESTTTLRRLSYGHEEYTTNATADERDLMKGCTRMFSIRTDEGHGPDTHIVVSYGMDLKGSCSSKQTNSYSCFAN